MISLLDDLTVVDDDYLIRIADGAQTVGDDEAGVTLHKADKERFCSHETPVTGIDRCRMNCDHDFQLG